jgi:hypothetical protein
MNPAYDPQLLEDLAQRVAQIQMENGASPMLTAPPVQNSFNISSLVAKLPSPRPYDGKRDGILLRNFRQSVENYMKVISASEQQKLEIFSFLLTDSALLWYQERMNLPQPAFPTISFALDALIDHFEPANFQRSLRDKFYYLKQTSSVKDYTDQIRQLLAMISPPIDHPELMDKFLRGLKPEIRMHVELKGCSSYVEAELCAVRADEVLRRNTFGYRRPYFNSAAVMQNPRPSPVPVSHPIPMELDNANSAPLPKLDDKERERCRVNNLCFRCRKPGHSAVNCRGPSNAHRQQTSSHIVDANQGNEQDQFH